MITVTRLNGEQLVLNADLIKLIEQRPDTIITLVNGDHVVVREQSREIVERVVEYGRAPAPAHTGGLAVQAEALTSVLVPRTGSSPLKRPPGNVDGSGERGEGSPGKGAEQVDVGTVIGVIVAVLAVVIGIAFGGNPLALIDVASVLIVFVGTLGATIICFPLARMLKAHKVVLKAFFTKQADIVGIIMDLVKYAELARREGILSLENLVDEMKDPFIVRGIKMAVDGTDPELIKQVMETELEAMMDRHAQGKQMLDSMGKYAPAFGMIGTLLGLIFMLGSMSDPSSIGPSMAVALITTLYGAMISNMFTGPLAEKLLARDMEEVQVKTIIIAGVMAIQSGDNPRVVQSKLATYLAPADRERVLAAA